MIIDITSELIVKLRSQGFYSDEMLSLYFVLKALKDNEVEMLDCYDDFNTSKRAVITYQKLYRLGFIDKSKEGSKLFYNITQKGHDFIDSFEPKSWLENWINLFPEKNQNGALRAEVEDIEPKMKTFIKKYKYGKDVIMTATKAYLVKESAQNYKYTKRAIYFIDKRGEGSLLATWCKSVAENRVKTGVLNDGSRIELIQTIN